MTKIIMAEASTINLHFCKLGERPSKSLPLAFFLTFLEQQNQSNNIVLRQRISKRNLVIYCTAQPAPPQPLLPPDEPKKEPWWRNWTLGAFLSIALPFSSNKMDPLVRIRSEFATILQTTEDIVEFIDRAATGIEKGAERRLDNEDMKEEGVPKNVMVQIEKAAAKLAKKARSVDYIIDTIQDIFLLESPDNNHARGVYRGGKEKKEKATEVGKEEKDMEKEKITTKVVDKQEEDHQGKTTQ